MVEYMLLEACSIGDLPAVKLIIEKEGTDIIETTDDAGKNPLHRAIENDKLDIVQYLIPKGANINELAGDRKSLLILAQEYREIFFYLASHKQGDNIVSSDDQLDDDNVILHNIFSINCLTPNEQFALVPYFVKKGININKVNDTGRTPLAVVINEKPIKPSEAALLVQYGADINYKMNDEEPPLIEQVEDEMLRNILILCGNIYRLKQQIKTTENTHDVTRLKEELAKNINSLQELAKTSEVALECLIREVFRDRMEEFYGKEIETEKKLIALEKEIQESKNVAEINEKMQQVNKLFLSMQDLFSKIKEEIDLFKIEGTEIINERYNYLKDFVANMMFSLNTNMLQTLAFNIETLAGQTIFELTPPSFEPSHFPIAEKRCYTDEINESTPFEPGHYPIIERACPTDEPNIFQDLDERVEKYLDEFMSFNGSPQVTTMSKQNDSDEVKITDEMAFPELMFRDKKPLSCSYYMSKTFFDSLPQEGKPKNFIEQQKTPGLILCTGNIKTTNELFGLIGHFITLSDHTFSYISNFYEENTKENSERIKEQKERISSFEKKHGQITETENKRDTTSTEEIDDTDKEISSCNELDLKSIDKIQQAGLQVPKKEIEMVTITEDTKEQVINEIIENIQKTGQALIAFNDSLIDISSEFQSRHSKINDDEKSFEFVFHDFNATNSTILSLFKKSAGKAKEILNDLKSSNLSIENLTSAADFMYIFINLTNSIMLQMQNRYSFIKESIERKEEEEETIKQNEKIISKYSLLSGEVAEELSGQTETAVPTHS